MKLGMVAHVCNPSNSRSRGRGIASLRPPWAIKQDLDSKKKKKKESGNLNY
jgi:hypothetical protein